MSPTIRVKRAVVYAVGLFVLYVVFKKLFGYFGGGQHALHDHVVVFANLTDAPRHAADGSKPVVSLDNVISNTNTIITSRIITGAHPALHEHVGEPSPDSKWLVAVLGVSDLNLSHDFFQSIHDYSQDILVKTLSGKQLDAFFPALSKSHLLDRQGNAMAIGTAQDTLALFKPDLLERQKELKRVGAMLEAHGFEIVAQSDIVFDHASLAQFYAEHVDKPFFPDIVESLHGKPLIALILRKDNAIADWRALLGPTDPDVARIQAPQSLRAIFGLDKTRNSFHGSDSVQSAFREIAFITARYNFA